MRAATVGPRTQATTRRGPEQASQVKTSTPKVCLSSSAHGTREGRAVGAGEDCSGGRGWRGTTSGRRRALGARTQKEADEVDTRRRDEGGQAPEEGYRREHQLGGPGGGRALHPVGHLPVGQKRQTLQGEGASSAVVAQPLQPFPVVLVHPGVRRAGRSPPGRRTAGPGEGTSGRGPAEGVACGPPRPA